MRLKDFLIKRGGGLMLNFSEAGLIFLYHGAVLFILLSLAITAIGGIIKISPFDKIEPAYVKTLTTVLLIEAMGAGLTTYQSLPTPQIPRAEEYSFELKYIDYMKDWIKARSPKDQTCISPDKDQDDETNIPSNYRDIITAYKRQKGVIFKTGKGIMFLATNHNKIKGNVLYKFPQDRDFTIMDVTGRELSNGKLKLHFDQHPKPRCLQCGGHSFPITFTKHQDEDVLLEGELFHDKDLVKNQHIKLANAELIQH